MPILLALFILGIFNVVLPWIPFAPVRSLDRLISGGLVAVAIALIVSDSFRRWMSRAQERLDSLNSSDAYRFMGACVLIYLAGVISYKLKAHQNLYTHATDLGFFSNICWNTSQGNWFYSSFLERNFMAVHVNWILWPLSFFYNAGGDSRVLLVAQAVFVAAAAPILWITVRNITGSFAIGAMAALLLVCSPFIGHHVENDFHPDSWQLPCLMAALYFWQKKSQLGVLIFSLLAIVAKEDVSIIVCGFGLFLMVRPGMRFTGALLILMGFSTFLFHTQVYTPRYLEGGQKSILFDRYPLLGDSFEEMIRNLYARPLAYFEALFYQPVKWWKAFQYVFPTVGLVLLAPVWLIPPAISLLPHLLSQAQTQLSLADIYSIPAQPFLFVGAAYGLLRLLKNPKWNARWKWIAGAAFLTAGLGVENAPRYFKRIPQERIETMSSIKELIPPDASLAAQQCLYPHFDTRRYVQLFPLKLSMATLQTRMLANPDYVFADRIGNALPYDEVVLSEEIKKMEANPAYEKLVDKENFVLFRRVKSEEKNWVVFNQ